MHNQINNVRPVQPQQQRPTQRRRIKPTPTLEEDIYIIILDVYDKMKYLIAMNGILAALIAIIGVYIVNVM